MSFETDASKTQMTIGGKVQTTVSVTDTEAIFKITDANNSTVKPKLIFASGKPNGHEVVD